MNAPAPTRAVTAALLAVQLLFGVHYLIARWVVDEIPPAAWAAVRVTSAAVILSGIALAGRRRWPRRSDLGMLAVCALFGVAANQVLFLEGLARTTPARAALINSQIPTFALVAAIALGQERLSRRKLMSFALGVAGVAVLLEADKLRLRPDTLAGDLLNLGNAASYGFFVALSRRVMPRHDPWTATATIFLLGSAMVAGYGGPAALGADWGGASARAVGGMIYAVLGATVLTYVLNVWALKRVRTSHVALWIFLQPLVAAGLDAALGTPPSLRFAAAAVLVFLALLVRDRT